MKVTSVKAIVLSYQYDYAIADALNYFSKRNAVIVQIGTDEGITGLGESACFGGPPFTTASMIEDELAKYVLGEDPTNIKRIMQRMWYGSRHHGRGGVTQASMSGINIALWDIVGKKIQTPLYKLFGAYTDKIEPYASSGFYRENKDIRDVANEVAGYMDEGFRFAKIKCARTPDAMISPTKDMPDGNYCTVSMEEDLARVEACVNAVKGKGKIMVDGNNAWTPFDAILMGRNFEKMGVYWFEEPVATDDVSGSAEVARALDMPISGYESEPSPFRFRDIISTRAVDIVQPDVIWTGGFDEVRKVAAMAELFHMPVVPHVFASAVCLVANMHLIASIPNGNILELDRNVYPLRDELTTEPIEIIDGFVRLPNKPGLGIELNEDTVKKYQIFENPR